MTTLSLIIWQVHSHRRSRPHETYPVQSLWSNQETGPIFLPTIPSQLGNYLCRQLPLAFTISGFGADTRSLASPWTIASRRQGQADRCLQHVWRGNSCCPRQSPEGTSGPESMVRRQCLGPKSVQLLQREWNHVSASVHADLACNTHSSRLLYRSFWTLTGSPSLLSHPAILQLANASNLTVPQVIYKFAQSQDIIPLSGTKNEEHMQQDVAVEKLPLQGDDVQGLLEAVGAFVAGPT